MNICKIKRIASVILTLTLSVAYSTQPLKGQSVEHSFYLPSWQEGYLDIHQIATGRGNAAFWVLPDGTTMIVDAGDLGDTSQIKQEVMPALPNHSKTPGYWIGRYVHHFLQEIGRRNGDKIDYLFLTHHHGDHTGALADLLKEIQPAHFVDRGWPNYDYPTRESNAAAMTNFEAYLSIVNRLKKENVQVEKFEVGRKQFVLHRKPSAFPAFEIRNISGSGKIWTGKGDITKELFPAIASLDKKEYPNENMISSTLLVKYGKFKYFAGADITGILSDNMPSWRDIETPVAKLIGPVDVTLMNHHGYSDTHNITFLHHVRPKVFINPVWDYYHPQPEVLSRILDTNIYPGQRLLLATGMVPGNVKRLGNIADQIKSGHIVLRVYPKGDKFQLFVLDATTQDYKLTYKSEVFISGTDQ